MAVGVSRKKKVYWYIVLDIPNMRGEDKEEYDHREWSGSISLRIGNTRVVWYIYMGSSKTIVVYKKNSN